MPGRCTSAVSNLRTMPATPPLPSNDAIEKAARKLAGSGDVFYWRSTVNHAYGDADALFERKEFGARALAAFQAKQTFVLIHDDLNKGAGAEHEAFVLTPSKQLLRLSTRVAGGASGLGAIKVQRFRRLIWVPGSDVAAIQQAGAR